MQNYLALQINRKIGLLKLLADYWNVPVNDVPELLTIKQKLTNATAILTPLLYKYNESFGGSYIDVKANLVVINTLDFTKVPEIKSSPNMKDFINLLNFTHANYSTHLLESSLNNLTELMNNTNPVNIIMGISPIYNLIVIDLSHHDDKKNNAFLNAILPFEQFIFINYEDDSDDNSDDCSLSLRSISNSSSSKHQTKRYIESYFQGGEGVATYINGIPEVYCSAGFSAVNRLNFRKYIITSARCLPNNTQEIYYAMWNSPINQVPFGVLRNYRLTGADYALIEKFDNNTYKLNPFIRNSLFRMPGYEPSFLFIDYFNYVGEKIPEGDVVCISGYESQVKCGVVTSSDVIIEIVSLRPGIYSDTFQHMIRASINGYLLENNRGGTVFSIGNSEYPYLFALGIVTDIRYVLTSNSSIVTIQPLFHMIQRRYKDFQNLRFIDFDMFQNFPHL